MSAPLADGSAGLLAHTADPAALVGLALVAVAAGVANTLAGGGSLLTLPALVLLGLEPTVANGTNRVSVLVSAALAARSLRAATDAPAVDRGDAAAAVAGAVLGAGVGVSLSEPVMRAVMAGALLMLLGTLVARPSAWLAEGPPRPPAGRGLRAAGFAAVGFYGGFLQAGVGLFLLAAGALLGGRDLMTANTHKLALVALFTVPALAVFVASGRVVWAPALALTVGTVAGSQLGVRLAVTLGAVWIRRALVVAALALVGRLLLG